jgi:hypothetical protein
MTLQVRAHANPEQLHYSNNKKDVFTFRIIVIKWKCSSPPEIAIDYFGCRIQRLLAATAIWYDKGQREVCKSVYVTFPPHSLPAAAACCVGTSLQLYLSL